MSRMPLRRGWGGYVAATVVLTALAVGNMPVRLPRAPEALRATQRVASAPLPGQPASPLGINLSTDTGARSVG